VDDLDLALGASNPVPDDPPYDVLLAEIDGVSTRNVSDLLEESAGAPILLLTREPVRELPAAVRQGLHGVLPETASAVQIAAAIEAVHAGLFVFPADEADAVFDSFNDRDSLAPLPEPLPARSFDSLSGLPSPLAEELTPREIEVLRLMAEGLANKELASRLAISEHTVKFHVSSILGKLGAASRTEAVTLGIRRGLVLL
jgi:DNA-binding NarL/FixJ family response regulator